MPRPLLSRVTPVARQHARLVERLLRVAVAGRPLLLLRVRLGPLGNGDHGRLRPDVDRLAPVQAFQAAALYRNHVLVLGPGKEGASESIGFLLRAARDGVGNGRGKGGTYRRGVDQPGAAGSAEVTVPVSATCLLVLGHVAMPLQVLLHQ